MRGRRHRLPRGLEPATRRRRFAAGAIDFAALAAVVGPATMAVVSIDRLAGIEAAVSRLAETLGQPRWRPVSQMLSTAVEIGIRDRRSPGKRLLGVHWVEARSAGPVPVSRELVRQLVNLGLARALRPLFMPEFERINRQSRELRERADALSEEKGELSAEDHRHLAFEGDLAPLGCWIRVGLAIVAPWATTIGSPLRQTLAERLTGVVLVRSP